MRRDRYREAGVDIAAGDAAVARMRPHAATTAGPATLEALGGFGALHALGGAWRDPVLVSATDGVGTKLLLAQRLGRLDTVGIDLVAMCVNDVAVRGARPLFLLDYLAVDRLDPDDAAQIVAGIAEGCRRAGCTLAGGETAELPGLLAAGRFDLAGFCVGVVERERLVDGRNVRPGDVLLGLPSTGVHANGFTLVRALCDDLPMDADPGGLGEPLGDALLRPSAIYVDALRTLHDAGLLRAAAHITGGGLLRNVPRCLPPGCGARLHAGAWPVPPVLAFLRRHGALDAEEMHRTFNGGLGLVVIVRPEDVADARAAVGGHVVGVVTSDDRRRMEIA
jgi:phosphoribosylformylglycinamidine cyclo-ligase